MRQGDFSTNLDYYAFLGNLLKEKVAPAPNSVMLWNLTEDKRQAFFENNTEIWKWIYFCYPSLDQEKGCLLGSEVCTIFFTSISSSALLLLKVSWTYLDSKVWKNKFHFKLLQTSLPVLLILHLSNLNNLSKQKILFKYIYHNLHEW